MFEKYLLWIKKFTIFGLFMTLDIQKLEFWLLVNFGTHGYSENHLRRELARTKIKNPNLQVTPTFS